jgi:hypothetical protein
MKSFTRVQFDIQPPNNGVFNLLFQAIKYGLTTYVMAIDNLSIRQFSCLKKGRYDQLKH